MSTQQIVCLPKQLPPEKRQKAALIAADINPKNKALAARLAGLVDGALQPSHIVALTDKYWHSGGVILTVGFLDNPPLQLRNAVLREMNAWGRTANVRFTESRTDPKVRIAREGGKQGGYWSYVGTDILSIEPDQPTMNLEGFSLETPESELVRVVRHETGHTMGFPHEHMRRELVERIDAERAFEYFRETQGWSRAEVRAQVLTALDAASIFGTAPDETSIMCYEIPGFLTTDGRPILGGLDINATDYAFAERLYPKNGAISQVDEAISVPRTPRPAASAPAAAPRDGAVLVFAPWSSPRYVASVVAALRET